ncbi:hypothetical protein E2C01_058357 [Portunus trituberculatus]|uniref:Uncharacterized protein n=1 Tax=Portunus trituberculatus TaxID=210409 RepID=A0A5B7H2X9_PORTR|nr:hypothetical protein [Portunus trituberculatus]
MKGSIQNSCRDPVQSVAVKCEATLPKWSSEPLARAVLGDFHQEYCELNYSPIRHHSTYSSLNLSLIFHRIPSLIAPSSQPSIPTLSLHQSAGPHISLETVARRPGGNGSAIVS